MRLSLYRFETGLETIGGNRVAYDLARGEAFFGAAEIDGPALMWHVQRADDDADGALLTRHVSLDPYADWLVRCDRVDFPLGGIAYRHTHPGPGIRYLMHGELTIESEGRSAVYGPGGAWFESGAEPVVAEAAHHLKTAVVRVMVLPAECAGKPTIRYVELADEERPKLQRATVLLEHAVALPR